MARIRLPSSRGGRLTLLPIILFAIYFGYTWLTKREEVPVTGRQQLVDMSVEQEMALGLQSYRQIMSESRVVDPAEPVVAEVREVGRHIARAADDVDPGFEWEFNVIADEQANAFALPGGKVAVYTGILPIVQNEDGLAVVMGHEVAHALARHGAERMTTERLMQFGTIAAGMSMSDMEPGQQRMVMAALGLGAHYGLRLPFSRDHESEADYIGLLLVAEACYDPREAPLLWQRMGQSRQGGAPPEWQSTHPSSETRIQQFEQWMPEALQVYEAHCETPLAAR
ncbi:MAG: M48 family metallopeptidase [Xanthomonadales bacterium]|nr:M48 family metallopeptidase [Xanthomonadales bacterium]